MPGGMLMRIIPKKNYFILLLMIVGVIVVTLFFRSYYNNNLKPTSDIYNYARVISSGQLDFYLDENPSTIIYISDKYDLNNSSLEELLKQKIISLNLYDNFVYLDKAGIDEKMISNFNRKYHTNFSLDKIPSLIIINDNKIISSFYNLTNDTLNNIDLGDVK